MKYSIVTGLLLIILSGCNSVTTSTDNDTNQPAMKMNENTMDHSAKITNEETFMIEMIPHHQEAVNSSTMLLARSQNPQLTALAMSIIGAQVKEIEMMQNRLTTNHPNSSYTANYQPMMRDTSTISAITTIETMYLEDMIEHHQGAAEMAEAVLLLNPSEEVKEYANQIITDQQSEISQMQGLLTTINQ